MPPSHPQPPGFQFKQFFVAHQGAAMKVGTDSILLGSWARLPPSPRHILDIGTGSGVLALMMAQRTHSAQIHAIELDPAALTQAQQNFTASPWSCRLTAIQGRVQDYSFEPRYDLIISNPPYFDPRPDLAHVNDARRQQARETTTLRFGELCRTMARLLRPGGQAQLILPHSAMAGMLEAALRAGLFLTHRLDICTRAGLAPSRSAFTLAHEATPVHHESLCIYTQDQRYTPAYRQLCREFYLRF